VFVFQSESTYGQATNGTPPASGTLPRATRARNRTLSQTQYQQRSLGDADHYAIPPPASVPSTRRTASVSNVASVGTPTSTAETPTPVTSTGWAKFDLSPLAENAQDLPSAPVVQPVAERAPVDPFIPDAFQSSNTQTVAERQSPSSGFADFPSPDVPKDSDRIDGSGVNANDKELSKDCQFADSFVANSFSFDDSIRPSEGAAATTTLDLMSPSSDRDSLSLPSPEAPPPPLPAGVLVNMPAEPPIPPPRPKARANGRQERSGSRSSLTDVNIANRSSPPADAAAVGEPAHTTSVVKTVNADVGTPAATSNVAGRQSSLRQLTSGGRAFPFEFPSDDSAPPPPPRPTHSFKIDGYRSLPRPSLTRGISMPSAPRSSPLKSATAAAPPPPPARRSVTNSTPVAAATFAQFPHHSPTVRRQQGRTVSSSPVASDMNITETTVTPVPRPRPQLRSSQTISGNPETSLTETAKRYDSPSCASSAPWLPQQSESGEPGISDPFVDVDPFAVSMVPDDPFGEALTDGFLVDLSRDFDSAALASQTFRTRAVTVDSVSSDIFDADFSQVVEGLRPRSTDSRSSDRSLTKTSASPSKVAVQSDIGLLIDFNSSMSEKDFARSVVAESTALPLESSSSTIGAEFVAFSDTGVELGGCQWVTFPGNTATTSVCQAESSQKNVQADGCVKSAASCSADIVEAVNSDQTAEMPLPAAASQVSCSEFIQVVAWDEIPF
jgi:hypothetical protein